MNILGISAFYHDSAACLVQNGELVAAAQEERFSRIKHDSRFPANAINYCIQAANISPEEIDYIAFYDKPLLKFQRILRTYLYYAPRGFKSFTAFLPKWATERSFSKITLSNVLNDTFALTGQNGINWRKKILSPEHHQSHAASAFFPSPFKNAAILTIDGVGEWATTSAGVGKDNTIDILYELHFPHSLGMLYTAFTYYTGFRVNSGEYKVMGLAPYGEPKYAQLILDYLMDLKEDGSFTLNMDYFGYCTGLTMTNRKFENLFGGPPRRPEAKITQREMDLARSVQDVVEEVVRRMVKFLKKETGQKNLCLAGGVALNCVANGKMLAEKYFEDLWIQPAAGDAGGAVGAALAVWYQYFENKREVKDGNDFMNGAYLGPSYENGYIERFLKENNVSYSKLPEDELFDRVAELLAGENIIGWFQGKMEFGPRALGARSIIGDARSNKLQSILNLKIKYRESFRPFAPSVLREKITEYFEMDHNSPYMLLVAPVKKERCIDISKERQSLWGIELLHVPRSDVPAITHVDYSARIQTVHNDSNPKYFNLIKRFEEKTGCPVIINTSFNVRGEPIVCGPEDAYLCFMRTEMDYLVLGDYLIDKREQNPLDNDVDWRKAFKLD